VATHSEHSQGPEASHSGMYWAVGIISLVLTAIAFGVILLSTGLRPYAVPIIIGLAVIQVAMQTFLFMHLREGRTVFKLFFGYGAVLAILIAWGIGYVLTAYQPGNPTAQAAKQTPAQMLAAGGQIVNSTCISCHIVNGHGATIGPNLNLVMEGRINLVPGGKPTSASWLTQWISDPPAVWSGAKMPNLGLQPQQVKDVVLYLTTNVK
jgi:heme/copper-type cytochrome/quinol oxidase subunit 4/cytochrome c2